MPGTDVVVVGRGRLGRAVGQALAERGVAARLLSRSTGFDVSTDYVPVDLGPVDAVVEATDVFTASRTRATQFFARSTRAVAAAARAAGARHVLVSIVGLDRPDVRRYGYYAAKAEQERLARELSGEALTVVRSTQWFEFAEQNLARMRWGPLAVVPAMTLRPVALEAVARVVAECVLGERTGPVHDLAGPEVLTLWEMTRALPGPRGLPVPVRVPGAAGRAFRSGALAPAEHEVEVVGPRFTDWLATRGR